MIKREGFIETGDCDICGAALSTQDLFDYPEGLKVSVDITYSINGKEINTHKEGVVCSHCHETLMGWIKGR